jgi:hypothetical protein
MDDFPKEV